MTRECRRTRHRMAFTHGFFLCAGESLLPLWPPHLQEPWSEQEIASTAYVASVPSFPTDPEPDSDSEHGLGGIAGNGDSVLSASPSGAQPPPPPPPSPPLTPLTVAKPLAQATRPHTPPPIIVEDLKSVELRPVVPEPKKIFVEPPRGQFFLPLRLRWLWLWR